MIQCSHLTKVYGSHTVLKDVSFQVKKGQWVLLTGEDGAGKTTLLHILMGFLTSYQGQAQVLGMRANRWKAAQRARVRFVPQGLCLDPGFAGSGVEDFEKNKAAQLMEALTQGPELLLLDEPLSFLSAQMQERVKGWLADFHSRGGTILLAQDSRRGWEGYYSYEIHLEKGVAVQRKRVESGSAGSGGSLPAGAPSPVLSAGG